MTTVSGSEPLPLSVFIIAHNEADRIAETLRMAGQLSDDLVVVDSGSTDDTRALAESLGARVFLKTPFPGYGPQKRFAEDQCRHTWRLNLDADEVLSPPLVEEIRRLLSSGTPAFQAYRIPIAETYPGEGAPHRWAYTLDPVRLYHRQAGAYAASTVHDRVTLNAGVPVGRLRHRIHHFSIRSLDDQITKVNAYAQLQAADLLERQVRISRWRLFTEFPLAFFKAFVLRRHGLRGIYGFMTSMNYAFSRYLRLAKYFESRSRYRQSS